MFLKYACDSDTVNAQILSLQKNHDNIFMHKENIFQNIKSNKGIKTMTKLTMTGIIFAHFAKV